MHYIASHCTPGNSVMKASLINVIGFLLATFMQVLGWFINNKSIQLGSQIISQQWPDNIDITKLVVIHEYKLDKVIIQKYSYCHAMGR